MTDLPFIDEHSRRIQAPAGVVWEALIRTLTRDLPASRSVARLVGCDPLGSSAEFGSAVGQTIPGFRIAELVPGEQLRLRGRHRFSDYQLTFLLAGGQLVARTHAAFPGLLGRLYRAAVIGSGGHRIVTRGILRRVARAAR